jgi:hypothetical protein
MDMLVPGDPAPPARIHVLELAGLPHFAPIDLLGKFSRQPFPVPKLSATDFVCLFAPILDDPQLREKYIQQIEAPILSTIDVSTVDLL